ncbi:MAG TPA: L,D-transpeptidase family protein [Jatrophihabitantaceae bacterium]|nr:L,D-transpeptidase family protein [Jatrophihabitantaceae bacterium]
MAATAARAVNGQRVTVTAPTRRSTVAVVQRWVHRAGKWTRVGAAMRARIGAAGLTRHPSEKLPATPIGSFSLTQAFGAAPNTHHRVTQLRYIHIRYGDTWGARPNRRTYNRYYNCHCRGATLFALRRSLFRYGLVIDYNRAPVVPGAGSGFFLHVTNGHPTGGCVAVAARNVRMLLNWLRPNLHPRIWIRAARR